MKKTRMVILALLVLSGCAKQPVQHVCTMQNERQQWQVTYQTDQKDTVIGMEQALTYSCQSAQEKQQIMTTVDAIFADYVATYGTACQLHTEHQDLELKWVLNIDPALLSEQQRDEMSLEKDEAYLIAQLEFAGYTCK